MLLYRQRLVMVSRISEQVVQELPFADRAGMGLPGQPMGLAVDDVTPTLYLCTSTPQVAINSDLPLVSFLHL